MRSATVISSLLAPALWAVHLLLVVWGLSAAARSEPVFCSSGSSILATSNQTTGTATACPFVLAGSSSASARSTQAAMDDDTSG